MFNIMRDLTKEKIIRSVDDRTILDKFAEDFCGIVEQFCKYIIVSGFVAIAHGRSRGTDDIDMIIEKLSREKFILLHEELIKAGFDCIQSSDACNLYDNYINTGVSIRYVRLGEHLPEMEVKFAKDSLDNYQLQTRKKMPFTGIDVYFSSVEMNIAFKEELLCSEKDLEDARHLRLIYEEEINEAEIDKNKQMIRRIKL